MKGISNILHEIDSKFKGQNITIEALLDTFRERGFGFFMFLFALPAALPLPAVGYGTVLGLPLVLLSMQQALGKHTIWLPLSWKKKAISHERFKSIIDRALPLIRKLEYFIKPRLEFVTTGIFLRIIGIFGLIMSLSVCVPLPLTNTVPSFGIALMSVGVLTRDGLAVIVGATIGMLWIFALAFIVSFLGAEGFDLIKATIQSHL